MKKILCAALTLFCSVYAMADACLETNMCLTSDQATMVRTYEEGLKADISKITLDLESYGQDYLALFQAELASFESCRTKYTELVMPRMVFLLCMHPDMESVEIRQERLEEEGFDLIKYGR